MSKSIFTTKILTAAGRPWTAMSAFNGNSSVCGLRKQLQTIWHVWNRPHLGKLHDQPQYECAPGHSKCTPQALLGALQLHLHVQQWHCAGEIILKSL